MRGMRVWERVQTWRVGAKGARDGDGGGNGGGRPREVEQRECKYSQRQRLKQSAN